MFKLKSAVHAAAVCAILVPGAIAAAAAPAFATTCPAGTYGSGHTTYTQACYGLPSGTYLTAKATCQSRSGSTYYAYGPKVRANSSGGASSTASCGSDAAMAGTYFLG